MKKRRFTEDPMVRNRVRRTRGLFPRSPKHHGVNGGGIL